MKINDENQTTPFLALTKGKVVTSAAMGLATGLLVMSGPAFSDPNQDQEKVTICHKGKEIDVALPAVVAHLLHGDSIGVCREPPPPAIRVI